MPRVGLLERATNKTIYLTPEMGDTINVIMYAENLGSIPPNTAILIITAGKNRHLLSLSSSEVKSARVRIVYDEEVGKTEQTVASVIKKDDD